MHAYTPLLEQFTPTHYDLSLTIERKKRQFHGIVTITGSVPSDTESFAFHAKKLSVNSVAVNGKACEYTTSNDEVHIKGAFVSGQDYIVVISFEGKMTDQMHGMYPCYYQLGGQAKELVATQFESHHAREVFPCIDEPAAKATFDLTLRTELGVTALSNMPLASQKEEGDWLVSCFDTTPRMSTYLLAWVVGELEATRGVTKDGIDVAIWSTPAQAAETRTFALDIAIRATEFFNDYFGVAYPLPKADHVALPDFSSGAMENWGLITYRELALLVDPVLSSIENKQYAALVIAHELSHQWFGNLVTMKWWNDLWLNESFANMMEYVAIDALEPTWDVWLDHASYEVVQALRRDSLDGVQAIQTEVNDPDEINSLFDPSIVYAKGGRLLRMLHTYIGDKAFRTGLSEYFKTHAYQNTSAEDLWASLSASSGQDIAELMEPWIKVSGYPVVSVDKEGTGVTLSQEQFFIGAHKKSSKRWPIPLASPHSSVPAIFNGDELTLPNINISDLLLNQGSPSHYIVRYNASVLPEVLKTIHQQPPVDRMKLINEYVLLAQAETIDSADLIALLRPYAEESSEAVWGLISMTIGEIKKFVETNTPEEVQLKKYVGSLSLAQFHRLGWDQSKEDSENDIKLRSLIINMMLYSELPEVVDEALQRYAASPIEALNPELRASILMAAVRHSSDPGVIDSLYAAHKKTSSSELRDDITAAITSSRDRKVLSDVLERVKKGDTIRRQDAARWIIGTLRNREGRQLAWQWIQDEWGWIETNFGSDKSYDAYPRYVASSLMTRSELEEFKTFFAPLAEVVALKRNITVGTTELEQRVGLIERQSAAVRSALLNLK